MKFLITGGCGFLGSNLAVHVLQQGHELAILDNLSREGSYLNLGWLKKQGKFKLYNSDTRSYNDVERVIREFMPDVLFHLAGQVAMTTSLHDPRRDFEINVVGGHNVIEAVRKFCSECVIIYSSTNKVYGDLEYIRYEETATRYLASGYENGFDENIPLHFQSPYGCSKGAIDQYMLDYARMFGLRTVVFRHSSIFGGRQFSTVDQGWIGWFVKQALEVKKNPARTLFTISGDGKQVRDVLFASDLINCYFSALASIDSISGQVFNIGGGFNNSLSLLELFEMLEQKLNIQLLYDRLPVRQSDQKVFIADVRKATLLFGWHPYISKEQGLDQMIDWMNQ